MSKLREDLLKIDEIAYISEEEKKDIDTTKETRSKIDRILNNADFDEKFQNSISSIEVAEAGTVRKIDILPDPEAFAKPVDTIFFAPGWLETLEANRHYIRAFVEKGYRVISLEHPREGGNTKDPNKRRLSAVASVVESIENKPEKMVAMGHSLGAIDISEYMDPMRDGDTQSQFKHVILTNPAGLTGKTMGIKFPKLLWNYVKNHMSQKKEADKRLDAGDATFYNGIPTSEIATEIRNEMDTRGGKEFGSNLPLAGLEAVRVGRSSIQKSLHRLRKNGHKVYVISNDDDRLLPYSSFDLKVSNNSTPDPDMKAPKIKYVDDAEADVDNFIALAGYHNSPRNAHRLDLDNNHWMILEWIDAINRDRKEKDESEK